MLVRIANTNDISAISRLYNEFYKLNNSLQPSSCAEAIEDGKYPESVICGGTGEIFVAETDKVIVGFIHAEEEKTPPFPSVTPHNYASVVDLYVMPEYRERGIGRALIEKVKDWSVNRGLEYIELVVLEENGIGREFYRKGNFKTVSHTMRYIL